MEVSPARRGREGRLVALNALRLYPVDLFIVVGKRDMAGMRSNLSTVLMEQPSVCSIERIDIPSEQFEGLCAFGEGQLVHAPHCMNFLT
jgi:hypothetical protein